MIVRVQVTPSEGWAINFKDKIYEGIIHKNHPPTIFALIFATCWKSRILSFYKNAFGVVKTWQFLVNIIFQIRRILLISDVWLICGTKKNKYRKHEISHIHDFADTTDEGVKISQNYVLVKYDASVYINNGTPSIL